MANGVGVGRGRDPDSCALGLITDKARACRGKQALAPSTTFSFREPEAQEAILARAGSRLHVQRSSSPQELDRSLKAWQEQESSKHLMAATAAHCVLFSGRVRLQLQKSHVRLS